MSGELPAAPPGYSDLSFAGQGATSRVYRAIDVASGEVVALKRLHRQLVRSSEALARLKRELDALGQLRHPNIAAVRGVIRWQGDPTIVMSFVEGRDLKERLREGKLGAVEVEHIARALFDVLATAHGAGIVHRDIKPQNVRITPSGQVVLLDFGSARLDAASQLTATGSTVGTPDYMAPELFAGSVYDPRADIFGVGATLFECATGRAPQLADSLAELAYQRTKLDAPPVQSIATELPDDLAQVIDRCLARAPEDRYATAALATWALDHPDAERASVARRSSHPPCLHCHRPIPPASRVCPRCTSDHPFAYARGLAKVDVKSVSEPKRFIEAMIARFPERANEREMIALAKRCAALSYSKQRVVSFIDEREAEQLAKELREAGVQAEAEKESFIVANKWLLACVLFGAFQVAWNADTLWEWGIVIASFIALSDRLYAVFQGLRGVLSRGPISSPEAGLREKLWQVLNLQAPYSDPTPHLPAPRPPTSTFTAAVVSIALFLVIPAELLMVFDAEEWRMEQLASNAAAARAALPAPRPLPTTQLGPSAGSGPLASVPVIAPVGVAAALSGISATTLAFLAVPTLLPCIALAFALRRRRRITLEARRIMRELDATTFTVTRALPPETRKLNATHTHADQLAQRNVLDAFASAALCRASDLAHLLPEASLARFEELIAKMAQSKREVLQAESLLSRCILETDGEQRLRFELLRVEGELEARAAEAWVARLGPGHKDG